jgi:N-methylhydantoinase A
MGPDERENRPSWEGPRAGMSPAGHGLSTPVIAVDTGGTFTDLVLLRDGVLTTLKVPSTPHDPAAAVLDGLRRLLGELDPAGHRIIVGSTVATNALLERSGARVVLVTNEGFEDVVEIGRQNRPQLYALVGWRLPPLVAREDRVGIGARMGPGGVVIAEPTPAELEALPGRVAAAEAAAVVLLHSYSNRTHESLVERALDGLGIPVSLSSRILPEFREFERTCTTVANAYVTPRVRSYLSRIRGEAGTEAVRVMGSNGGTLPVERAIAEPVQTVLSGPAGGVVGALNWATRCGVERILSFDMGGTSTDVSLVPGAPLQTREGEVGGVPIAIPLTDIHTVGAGGGSIVGIDPGGALRVGPTSAGAEPGPIAYGRGGREVTVTDAHVFLGRLPPRGLLGGTAPLDRAAVVDAMEELAAKAGISAVALAEGILSVANTAMERALRVISIERGVDPSDHHLVAFGGAAGLHVAELAGRLRLAGALVPPDPGLLSAFGMLVAPVVRDRSRTVLVAADDVGAHRHVDAVLLELEDEARAEMLRDGAAPQDLLVERWVDARYVGQSFELRVPADGWASRFHAAHEQRYGYRRSTPVEAVTVRVRVEAPGEAVQIRQIEDEPAAEERETGIVIVDGEEVEAPILQRSSIAPDAPARGPAVIVEYSSTTWCPPGWSVARDRWGVLHLSRP